MRIDKAVSRAIDGSSGLDVAACIYDTWSTDPGPIVINNHAMGGDPKTNVKKQLVIDYTIDGRFVHTTLNENDSLDLPTSPGTSPHIVELRERGNGELTAIPWFAGKVKINFALDKTWQHTVTAAAPVKTVEDAWDVFFPPNRGAPEKATFDPQMVFRGRGEFVA